MKRIFLAFLPLLLLSCSKEIPINGEMYVATAGAGSYKLAASQVVLLTDQELRSRLIGKTQTIKTNFQELEAVTQKCVDRAAQALKEGMTSAKEIADKCKRVHQFSAATTMGIVFSDTNGQTGSTDSEGRFSFVLKNPGKHYLIAKGSRLTADVTEDYVWVIPIIPGQSQYLLNNLNMLSNEHMIANLDRWAE